MLRAYLRQRALLVEQGAQHIQHRQKSLTQMNLKRGPLYLNGNSVLSDITGVTGMLIIDAILNGERHPLTLARLRDERCRHDEATIAKALVGTWRVEYLFTLKPSRELYRTMQRLVAECEAQIEAHLPSLADRPAPTTGPDLPPARKKPHRKGRVAFDAPPLLAHQAGVDLTRIDGIDTNTALTVLGEIGLDRFRWPTEKHFASWLALCLPSSEDRPDNRESAGRRQSGRPRPSSHRAAAALRMAAQGLHRSQTALGAYLRRMKAARGAPKAITATARKLALMISRALQHGLQDIDPGQDWYERQYQDRLLKSLTRKALKLGYQLTPTPPTTT